MKRMLFVLMAVVLATSAIALAGDDAAKKEKAAPTTLTGEVLDLYCYMGHPESATGTEHAKCATACISKGLPIGFLTADGTIYLIIGKDHASASTDVTADGTGAGNPLRSPRSRAPARTSWWYRDREVLRKAPRMHRI